LQRGNVSGRGWSNLKAITYLLSALLIAPGAVLAYGFWTLTEAIRQNDMFKMLIYLLARALEVLEWGGWFTVGGGIIWLTLAFLPKYRMIGALGIALLAMVSLVEFFVATGLPKAPGELFIPALSLAGLIVNLWLVWDSATYLLAAKSWSARPPRKPVEGRTRHMLR
jgi:hypothetical protein